MWQSDGVDGTEQAGGTTSDTASGAAEGADSGSGAAGGGSGGDEGQGVLEALTDGEVDVAWGEVVNTAGNIWNMQLFTVDETQIRVSQLIIALLMLILGSFAAKMVSRAIGSRVLGRLKLESGPRHAIQKIAFYLLMFGVVMLSLQTAGVPLTVFTIFGGALALGIGFGSQNVMNNFISGLILLIERPIAIGQLVELNGDVGTVTKIGARSTQLQGYNGAAYIIPNSMLLENTVVNWNVPDRRYRSEVAVGFAYGSDTAKAREILLEAMSSCEKILQDQEMSVLFTSFGDNALHFEAHFWTRPTSKLERLSVESDLRFMIDKLCRDAGVVIAFPQRDVHLDTLSPLEVRVRRDRDE